MRTGWCWQIYYIHFGMKLDRFLWMFVNLISAQWKLSALPPWKWIFGEFKAVVVRIHMLHKWNVLTFIRKAKFHTEKEAKWMSKSQKSKVFRIPFLISQQNRLFDQNSFTIQMLLGIFQSKISHGNESRITVIIVALPFISLNFRYEILYAKYVDSLEKLKK
jgi:hypothetical protein